MGGGGIILGCVVGYDLFAFDHYFTGKNSGIIQKGPLYVMFYAIKLMVTYRYSSCILCCQDIYFCILENNCI